MPLAARIAAILLATVSMLVGTPTPAAASATSIENRFTQLLDAERAQRGLPGLRVDVRLIASARDWAAQMGERGRLAHSDTLAAEIPGEASTWGENVGSTTSTDAADSLHAAFMASGGHREIMLDGDFTDVGIGVAVVGGQTWVVQRFTGGAPARVAAAVPATADLAVDLFGGGRASHAVIVRDDVYADALASGPLAGTGGPILLNPTGGAVHPAVRAALDATLPRSATVWLAGGEAAVSSHVASELSAAGWAVRRVAGSGRVETAAAIARVVSERHGQPATALVATAAGWPDAAAGGAYGARSGAPILLSGTDAVPALTVDTLRALRPGRIAALGGRAALSDAAVEQLGSGAQRVAGATREGTSAQIASRLWGYRDASPNTWIAVPAYTEDAWAWAVGAAPLAAQRDAAILLVGDEVSEETIQYLGSLGYGGSRSATLLVHGPVSETARAQLQALLN